MSPDNTLPPLPHWCEAGSPFAQQLHAYARSAIAAHEARQGVPEGWVLVPKETTPEMKTAGRIENSEHGRSMAEACYRAMLSAKPEPAAPKAPQAEKAVDEDAMRKFKKMLFLYEQQWHRMGELWERCQGKAWPEKESEEFGRLRDEKSLDTRMHLLSMFGTQQASEPAAPVHEGPTMKDNIQQQASAWEACYHELSRVLGDDFPNEPTGKGSAIAAIRLLASRAGQVHEGPTEPYEKHAAIGLECWFAKDLDAHESVYKADDVLPYVVALRLASHPGPAKELVAQPTQAADELLNVIRFLLGEASLDGYWFSERPPYAGAYWWRTNLRAALNKQEGS